MTTPAPIAVRRRRRGEVVALTIALGWSAALLVAAVVVPIYSVQSASSTGTVVLDSPTLVGVNGAWVLLVVAIPLVLSAAVTAALWLRGLRPGAGPLAWVFAGLSVAFALVAMLSIGPLIAPVAGCLIYACVTHGPRPGETRDAATA